MVNHACFLIVFSLDIWALVHCHVMSVMYLMVRSEIKVAITSVNLLYNKFLINIDCPWKLRFLSEAFLMTFVRENSEFVKLPKCSARCLNSWYLASKWIHQLLMRGPKLKETSDYLCKNCNLACNYGNWDYSPSQDHNKTKFWARYVAFYVN